MKAAFLNDASLFAMAAILQEIACDSSYQYANTAISCQDWSHRSSAVDMQWKERIAATETSSLKGISPALGFVHNCVGWPRPRRNPPHKINIPKSDALPTILMTSNLYDPATPLAMSVNLQSEIGLDRSVLVNRNASGHGIWLQPSAYDGETVAAINKYLLELELPAQGTVFES